MLLQDLIQQFREQVVELQLHDRSGVEGQETLQDQIDGLENRVDAILTYLLLIVDQFAFFFIKVKYFSEKKRYQY